MRRQWRPTWRRGRLPATGTCLPCTSRVLPPISSLNRRCVCLRTSRDPVKGRRQGEFEPSARGAAPSAIMLRNAWKEPGSATMKIMQLDDVPLVRGLEHRGGTFHSRTMAEGVPGTPGNFKFSLSRLGTDYSGPRHRHNFDQYRFMIEGESDYGQDGPLKAGMLGYYPEGVPYGPQVNKTEIFCAVLQFGGASGSRLSAAARGQGRHGGTEEVRRVQGRHLPSPRRRCRQAQHGRLSGDLGAHARPRHGLSEGPLRCADHDGFGELPVGAGEGRQGRLRKAVRRLDRAPHRSRPAPARGGREPSTSKGAASTWCSPAPASAKASRSSSIPAVYPRPGRARHACTPARPWNSCTTGCPIFRTWRRPGHTSGVSMQAAE